MDASTILRMIRRRLLITRADLARLADVSPSTVGRIEKKELDPTWSMLCRLLEATGFMLHGNHVVPIGDGTAARAARILIDRALGDGRTVPAQQVAAEEQAIRDGLTGPEGVEVWWQRWDRAGWLSLTSPGPRVLDVAHHAGVVARGARAGLPDLVVGEGRGWRDLALRIDEAGFDYAVSGLSPALELPDAGTVDVPRIYVSDPAMVVSVLRLEPAASDRGILLASTDGAELEGSVAGLGICFTSIGQAIIDGYCGDTEQRGRADSASALFHLMWSRLRES